jgi:hypothetical protein
VNPRICPFYFEANKNSELLGFNINPNIPLTDYNIVSFITGLFAKLYSKTLIPYGFQLAENKIFRVG